MRNRITTALLAVALLGFTYLGIANITKTHNKLKTKDIQLQSKQSDLQLLEIKFNKLNIDLQKEQGNKTQDQKKIEELQKAKDDLQKSLEKAEYDLQTRAEAKRIAAEKLQRVAEAVAGATPAYASEGGCGGLRVRLTNLGIIGAELDAAITLATRESSCRSSAVNASSGACGEFQSLPCGKWGTPGTTTYLVNAIAYSRNRYGGFVNALAHSYAFNWY